RSEWPVSFTSVATPPWALTGQPCGRCCGVALLCYRAGQGRRPLPAHGALQHNTTAALNPSLSD
ncbi:MAG: hypothetical protein PF630_06055, partial [Gammaproteobacteria bacterium]|nr:hypothetical protein [Gammaproteobacteria bacterium]